MGASDAYERNPPETVGATPGHDRFEAGRRIGVMLVQHEANSFAMHTTALDAFTLKLGAEADGEDGANSELDGACAAIRRLGGHPVPILSAHAMPAGPLDEDAYDQLIDTVVRSLRAHDRLDALVVSLHGALCSADTARGDRELLAAIRDEVGPDTPIALTLDLHGNATEALCTLAEVTTGYHTNPHVDQAETGRRAVAMLASVMAGTLRPVTAVETCPAIFPDESLRIPGGVVAEILDRARADAADTVHDISVFPTQPWLDAPGIGFTAVVTTHDDAPEARRIASAIAREVWERRHEFVVDRLLTPEAALVEAMASPVRPFVIAEAADAPTAGASGDGTDVLRALLEHDVNRSMLITICDPAAATSCHTAGEGAAVSLMVGASIDPRWSEPVELTGTVERLGGGAYTLSGTGYTGMTATMGRFAVVRRGSLRVLVTEVAAWSSDPGTWRHAGLDPFDVDVLCVRSCTDYRANFPESAASAVVADVPGVAASRLDRFRFERCGVIPFPVDPHATY